MHVKLRESAGHNNRLPKESVERLEEEFEQSRDLIKDRVVRLSKELQLSQTTIRLWWGRQIVKREKYGPGEVKVIEKRHTFTQEEKDYLQTEFEKNNYPSAEEYREYAKHLGLTLANIKYFFNTRRTELRKKKELEIVKDQFDKIEKEKVERLEEVLEEMKGKRVLFKTRVELAKQLELSYQLVTYWFETKMEERTRERKMQMTRKRKIKKEEELEMEGEDEDDARNMEEDADSSDDDEADTGYM